MRRQSDVKIANRARISLCPFVTACHQPLGKILHGRLRIRRAGQNDRRIDHATYFLTARSTGRAADSGAAGLGTGRGARRPPGVIVRGRPPPPLQGPPPVVLHAAPLLVRHRRRRRGGAAPPAGRGVHPVP